MSTPNPRERALLVQVEESVFADNPDILPPEGTLYGDFPKAIFARDYDKKYSGYIYTGQSDHGLLFGRPKTDEEKNVPFRKFTRTENYAWEKVVLDWRAEPDLRAAVEMRDGSGNAFFQNKWNARYHLLDAIQGASQVEYELFLSPTKFTNLGKPIIQQPVNFDWNLPGDLSQPIGRALVAKRIRVPLKVLGPVVLEWRTYEPTTPNGRARHLMDDDEEQLASGLWLRTRKWVNPPTQQTIIHDR